MRDDLMPSNDIPSKRAGKSMKLWALVALVVAGFALVEVGVRILFPVPPLEGFERLNYSPNRIEQESASLAHASLLWASEPDHASAQMRLNLYGFRDDDWSYRASVGRQRLLVVGDSMVEGYLTSSRGTISRSFERTSRSLGWSVEGLNLGVGGAGPDQYGPLVIDAVPALGADAVLVVLYANDFVEVPDPSRWTSRSIVPREGGLRLLSVLQNLVTGQPVARFWHGAPQSLLVPVPDPSNPWSEESFTVRMSRLVAPRLIDAMRRGVLNPNLSNFASRFSRELPSPADLSGAMRALKEAVGDEVELRFAYLPSKLQVSDVYLEGARELSGGRASSLLEPTYQAQARAFLGWCSELELRCLDLTAALRKAESEGQRLYWTYDDHMTPFGYQWVGERLARWWQTANQPLPDRQSLAAAADGASR